MIFFLKCDSLKNLLELKFIDLVKNDLDLQKVNKNYSNNNSILLVDFINLSEHFKLDLLMVGFL